MMMILYIGAINLPSNVIVLEIFELIRFTSFVLSTRM